jgi:hypothetical protein
MGSLESGDERKERLVRSWTLYNVRTNIITDMKVARGSMYHVHIIDNPMTKKQK